MSYDPNDPRITAYVLDELDSDQRVAFESDLKESEQLRQEVHETRVVLERLSRELREEPPMALSDAHREAVAREIAQAAGAKGGASHGASEVIKESSGRASSSPRIGRGWAALIAIAASLLLLCGVASTYHWYNAERMGRHVAAVSAPDEVAPADVPQRASSSREDATSGSEAPRGTLAAGKENDSQQNAEFLAFGDGQAGGRAPSDSAPSMTSDYAAAAPSGGASQSRPAPYAREESRVSGGSLTRLSAVRDKADPASLQAGIAPASGGLGTSGGQPPALPSRTGDRPVASSGDQSVRLWGIGGAKPGPGATAPAPTNAPYDAATDEFGASAGMMGGYGSTKGQPQTADRRYGTTRPAGAASNEGRADYGGSEAGKPMSSTSERFAYGNGYGSQPYGGEYGEAYGGEYGMGYDAEYGGYAGSGPDHGSGPGWAGDRYEPIVENPFQSVQDHPLSTFSIDVDTASYSKVRMFLMQHNRLPRPDAVRIEELVNYFTYDYQGPQDEVPFAAHIEVADCPWTPAHRLVRFGIKGQEMQNEERPTSNLVFLLDVSGSMNRSNKLPLVKSGMKMLVDQLGENDRVAIAVYAGAAGLVLPSTTGDDKQLILDALDRLHAGGSTNGGEGILLAYQTALDNFVAGGVNRVILCTDGDFNVGVTGTDELVRIAEEHAKTGIFLSVLGFGMGNHNDAMLEQISNKGNGNYAFIDSESEARKVLVEEMTGTLVTIAKDVKIQVEFNPLEVAAYRLIGYENRILAAEDFNDDTKDAGEIGAGHTVTALYEVVPAGAETEVSTPPVDELRYQSVAKLSKQAKGGELLTLKIRYKQPDGDTSSLLTFPTKDEGRKFGQASRDFRFAAAVASFGMLLRNSQYKGNATFAGVLETATEAAKDDTTGYRDEFLKMVERAKQITGG